MITFDLSAYLSFSRNRRGGTHIRLIYLLSNNNSIIFDGATSPRTDTQKGKKESIVRVCMYGKTVAMWYRANDIIQFWIMIISWTSCRRRIVAPLRQPRRMICGHIYLSEDDASCWIDGCELGPIVDGRQGVNSIDLNPFFPSNRIFDRQCNLSVHTALILLISYLQNRM